MAAAARDKDGVLDLEELIEQELKVDRDAIRNRILGRLLSERFRELGPDTTLDEFAAELKKESKDLAKYFTQQPLAALARELAGTEELHAEISRLKEQLRGGGAAPGRRTRRRYDATEVDAYKKKVIEYLKQNPKSTVGQLAKGLMVDVAELKKPLGELRKDNRLRMEGERRSMRYSAA
jgi:predicted HTH transcriptional regulator